MSVAGLHAYRRQVRLLLTVRFRTPEGQSGPPVHALFTFPIDSASPLSKQTTKNDYCCSPRACTHTRANLHQHICTHSPCPFPTSPPPSPLLPPAFPTTTLAAFVCVSVRVPRGAASRLRCLPYLVRAVCLSRCFHSARPPASSPGPDEHFLFLCHSSPSFLSPTAVSCEGVCTVELSRGPTCTSRRDARAAAQPPLPSPLRLAPGISCKSDTNKKRRGSNHN